MEKRNTQTPFAKDPETGDQYYYLDVHDRRFIARVCMAVVLVYGIVAWAIFHGNN